MTDENQELDYTYPIGQPPTSLQSRFADFLISDEVGYSPASAKTKEEAFREGVRLAVALRIPFQASDTNRNATAQERIERAALKAQQAEEREAARLAREEERAAKEAAPAPETVPAPAKAPAKKAPAKKTATPAPTPAAAPAPARQPARRAAPRRAAAAPAAAAEAPF